MYMSAHVCAISRNLEVSGHVLQCMDTYGYLWMATESSGALWGHPAISRQLQTAQTAADRSPEMRVRAAPRGLPRSGEVVKGTINDIMMNGSHVFDL